MNQNKTQSKPDEPEQRSGKGLDAMSCSSFEDWKSSDDCDETKLELQAKWANLQHMRDCGRSAYEADVRERPTYHDGTKRKPWKKLGDAEQWSWGREYNLETNA
jgi:hypothetical protein